MRGNICVQISLPATFRLQLTLTTSILACKVLSVDAIDIPRSSLKVSTARSWERALQDLTEFSAIIESHHWIECPSSTIIRGSACHSTA